MAERSASVLVVDNDISFLRAVSRLLRVEGYTVETFSSPGEFMGRAPVEGLGCVILDLRMPGMSGLEVQQLAQRQGETLPVVFLTGNGSIADSVKAMRQGAVDFLRKPVAADDLFRAVSEAVQRHEAILARLGKKQTLLRRFETLTSREKEVGILVAQGLLNKQIAGDLRIAEKTVKIHRARALAKLGVKSVPDLVRFLEAIEVTLPEIALTQSSPPDQHFGCNRPGSQPVVH